MQSASNGSRQITRSSGLCHRRISRISSISRGFTLIELMIVAVIIAVGGALAFLQFRPMMMESRAPDVARDMQRAATKIAASRQGGDGPYTAPDAVTLAELGSALRNSSFAVSGNPATSVTHSLGNNETAATVTIGPVDVGSGAGSGFTIFMAGVDPAACKTFVKGVASTAVGIQVGGGASVTTTGVGANVRAVGGRFLPNVAATACDAPNSVDIALVFR